MGKQKKITVGVLVSGIMDDFTKTICKGVIKAARKRGVNLVIFRRNMWIGMYRITEIFDMNTSMEQFCPMHGRRIWMPSWRQRAVLGVLALQSACWS